MELNKYNHHPDCGLKNISMEFSSCGCFGVWDTVKELEAKVEKLSACLTELIKQADAGKFDVDKLKIIIQSKNLLKQLTQQPKEG